MLNEIQVYDISHYFIQEVFFPITDQLQEATKTYNNVFKNKLGCCLGIIFLSSYCFHPFSGAKMIDLALDLAATGSIGPIMSIPHFSKGANSIIGVKGQ
jgi:hypothetical protein